MDLKLQFNWDSARLIKRIFIFLVSCELAIFFLDIIFNHYKVIKIGAVRRLFNITREDGISNFFSSFQLFIVGAVLFLVYFVSKQVYQNRSTIQEKGWLILACFFSFMGFDDATKFHERVGTTAKIIFSSDSHDEHREVAQEVVKQVSVFDMFPSYDWQIVFGPFFALMGLFILWYLWKNLYDKTSKYLFIGGLSLYVIAVFMDFIEGFGTGPYSGIATALDLTPKQVRHLAKAYEETFEMIGTTFFLIAFLRHLFYLIKDAAGLNVNVDSASS